MIDHDAEWETATDPRRLLDLLPRSYSHRKLRLSVCECLRCVLPTTLCSDDAHALAFAERLAEDEANVDPEERLALWGKLDARSRMMSSGSFEAWPLLIHAVGENAYKEARWLLLAFDDAGISSDVPSRIIREMFRNPLRPIDFAPWRTATATALALGMYASRDFCAMPILADALQDAGCDNDEVLTHCRDANATHVRGCWVVDGVLGKA